MLCANLPTECEPDFRDPQSGGIEPEKKSGTENGFLPSICPKSVPDTLSAHEGWRPVVACYRQTTWYCTLGFSSIQ